MTLPDFLAAVDSLVGQVVRVEGWLTTDTVQHMEVEASGVEIDAAVVFVLGVVGSHLVPPWRRAGLIPLRGCRDPASRLKDPR